MKIVDDVLWGMEFPEVSNLCLIDLSAAFDTIYHDILLCTHNINFGLQDTVLQCLDNYLHPGTVWSKWSNHIHHL